MADPVNLICRFCIYQLCQIRVIQRNLSVSAIVTLVSSFILMRLGYCNSVLANSVCISFSSSSIFAALVVANKPKHSHILQRMREPLHWLQGAERIFLKIILLGRASVVDSYPAFLRGFVCQFRVGLMVALFYL